MSDNIDAKDMTGVALQGFLDEGDTEKVKEVAEHLYRKWVGDPEPIIERSLGLAFGGLLVGAGIGGGLGFIFTRRLLETKYEELAEAQVAEAREHYYAKEVARENAEGKGELKDIIRERGYAEVDEDEQPEVTATPPMAVTPPSAVVARAEEARDEEAETPPPPEEDPEPEVRNVFREHAPPEDDWDWHKERSQRSPMRPYVIHVDERHDHEAYDTVTYTYYAVDDVVCNERDEIISVEDRERIIGEANLEKFGHGSEDPAIVYVRNDTLEMDMEVIHSPNSYAMEVHGLEPEIKHADRRRGRTSFDDD